MKKKKPALLKPDSVKAVKLSISVPAFMAEDAKAFGNPSRYFQRLYYTVKRRKGP